MRDQRGEVLVDVAGQARAVADICGSNRAAAIMLVAMLVLGTPYAGPLAAVVLVGGLIPYLGTLSATLLVLLVALGGQGMWQAAALLAVALAYFVLAKLGLTLASINPSASPIWPQRLLPFETVVWRKAR